MVNIILIIVIVIALLFIYFMFNKKSNENLSSGAKIVNYNTEWCGFSKRFQPVWEEFTNVMKDKHPEVDVVDMKCDKDGNEIKCRIPEVSGFPTVVLHVNDKKYVFEGKRETNDLVKFVESFI